MTSSPERVDHLLCRNSLRKNTCQQIPRHRDKKAGAHDEQIHERRVAEEATCPNELQDFRPDDAVAA
jgi:hypothetical protein